MESGGRQASTVPSSNAVAVNRRQVTYQARKARSLYGENPSSRFGPKAQLCQGTTLTIQDPSSQKLTWIKKPQTVLIIKKLHDEHVVEPFKDVVKYLVEEHGLCVVVEAALLDDDYLRADAEFERTVKPYLRILRSGVDSVGELVDFVITVGGDGTLIHASSLFQQSIPPVLAFNLGSLGFLTPFAHETYKENISSVVFGDVGLTLRSRLKCIVCRKGACSDASFRVKDLENGFGVKHTAETVNSTYSVLNEVVVDRGPSPYLCNVDLYVEGKLITSVQGDGVIIATPTGSTAYAAAAGASMIHPSVPAILITPICPHSLSFRPIVLPAGVEVSVVLSGDSRNTAWASFDGRNRQEIRSGDRVRITTSIYPLPSVCASNQLSDWFSSLAECLHWNVRRQQRPLSSGLSSQSLSPAASMLSDLSVGDDLLEQAEL